MVPSEGPKWDACRGTFTAAFTWAAYYYLFGSVRPQGEDMLQDAETVFVNALESSMETEIQVRASSLYLAASTRWIEICGKQLLAIARGQGEQQVLKDMGGNWSNIIDDGGEWLWQGGHCLSVERWEFWKQRYQQLASLDMLDAELREIASQAAVLMQNMEEQDKHTYTWFLPNVLFRFLKSTNKDI